MNEIIIVVCLFVSCIALSVMFGYAIALLIDHIAQLLRSG